MSYLITNNGFLIGKKLQHSPKGTTWKDHKYIKKVNGRYIYETISDSADNIDKFINKTKTAVKNSTIVTDVKWEAEQIEKRLLDEAWTTIGKSLDKIGDKRLKHELSKNTGRYQYSDYWDGIREKKGKESGYSISTNLKLDDFAIINGEIYKKNLSGGYYKVK